MLFCGFYDQHAAIGDVPSSICSANSKAIKRISYEVSDSCGLNKACHRNGRAIRASEFWRNCASTVDKFIARDAVGIGGSCPTKFDAVFRGQSSEDRVCGYDRVKNDRCRVGRGVPIAATVLEPNVD